MNLFWQELLSLFLNRPCAFCQRGSSQPLCAGCQAQVLEARLAPPLAVAEWQGELPLWAWGGYKDGLKRAIATLKYEKSARLALLLGRWMAEHWKSTGQHSPSPRAVIVVPIPLHASKLKERGFNQADLLAQVFCRYTRLPYLSNGLIRAKVTQAQFGLSKSDRSQNLKDAFRINPKHQNRLQQNAVLLLDDIYTTGSTARSAQHTLRQSQIPLHGMVTLARA